MNSLKMPFKRKKALNAAWHRGFSRSDHYLHRINPLVKYMTDNVSSPPSNQQLNSPIDPVLGVNLIPSDFPENCPSLQS